MLLLWLFVDLQIMVKNYSDLEVMTLSDPKAILLECYAGRTVLVGDINDGVQTSVDPNNRRY